MLHSWYDPQRVLKEHPGTRSRRQNQAASFLVRPAEGIERLDIDAVTEQDGWLHSWYDPQRVLKVLSFKRPWSAFFALHSWYDPQRVLKVQGSVCSARARAVLHSWYDPQRVLKGLSDNGCEAPGARFIPGTTRRGY